MPARDEADRIGPCVTALLATSLVGKGLFAGQEWDVGISGVFASAIPPTNQRRWLSSSMSWSLRLAGACRPPLP